MNSKIMAKIFVIASFLFFYYAMTVQAEIRVYDANNKYLGILVDLAGGPGSTTEIINIYIPKVGIAPIMRYGNDGYILLFDSPVYESNDCSGTPYIPSSLAGFPIIVRIGDKHYIMDLNSSKKSFIPKSMGNEFACGIYPTNIDTTAIENTPFKAVPSESLPIPFVYPLHFEYSSSDINGDGKIGLDDAIYILQTVSGLRN